MIGDSASTARHAKLIMARLDELAAISAEPGAITRLNLTPEHRLANELVARWMRQAGMATRTDEIGNLIGRYEGAQPGAPALILGSHLDTVRNAGRYDGTLGVVLGIAVVAMLAENDQRLPFAVEVISFADEEGVRFQAGLLGSRALTGTVDPAVLQLQDAEGVSLADALRAFGLAPESLARAARNRDDVMGYLEVHIEQGPVLERVEAPVGVVTAIAGAVRHRVTVIGTGGHAGTVPMNARRDALAAAAEGVLALEEICRNESAVNESALAAATAAMRTGNSSGAATDAAPGTATDNVSGAATDTVSAAAPTAVVGTVGEFRVVNGAANVIPGRVQYSVDLRAANDAAVRRVDARLRQALNAIASRRGVTFEVEQLYETPACAFDGPLMRALEQAVIAEGLPLHQLPSGAGHDAMTLSGFTDAAMLFVRCRDGVSHHPDESITASDVQRALAVTFRTVVSL